MVTPVEPFTRPVPPGLAHNGSVMREAGGGGAACCARGGAINGIPFAGDDSRALAHEAERLPRPRAKTKRPRRETPRSSRG